MALQLRNSEFEVKDFDLKCINSVLERHLLSFEPVQAKVEVLERGTIWSRLFRPRCIRGDFYLLLILNPGRQRVIDNALPPVRDVGLAVSVTGIAEIEIGYHPVQRIGTSRTAFQLSFGGCLLSPGPGRQVLVAGTSQYLRHLICDDKTWQSIAATVSGRRQDSLIFSTSVGPEIQIEPVGTQGARTSHTSPGLGRYSCNTRICRSFRDSGQISGVLEVMSA